MNAFGRDEPVIIPLDISKGQFEIYQGISKSHSHSFLFESLAGPEELAETSIMGFDPKVTVTGYADRTVCKYRDGRTRTIPSADPLRVLQEMLPRTKIGQYRYVGGAVGMVDYEAMALWEKSALPDDEGLPLMEFGIYDDGILYDHREKKPYYFYYDKDRFGEITSGSARSEPLTASDPVPSPDRAEFSRMVNRAKEYIRCGDIFQAVLSRRFEFEVRGDMLEAYAALRRLNPSPYLYHIKSGKNTAVGASPEMLVRVTGRTVETFPIAGTRKVTGDAAEDKRLQEELASDKKELAEHTMLVDLGRNDVGRVCRPGSVAVDGLMEVKRFSHVQHMVTHVSGQLGGNAGMFDAFRAVFPAGTVSGAPKVRAMQIISELEGRRRGPYAGAVGYFSYNGCCDFAISIRSIFARGSSGFVQAGAGIVYDSDPDCEFAETEHKAGAMLQALREASK